MHAGTPALLTKQLRFPNMNYCHGNTIILGIVLKLKNPLKISLLIRKCMINRQLACYQSIMGKMVTFTCARNGRRGASILHVRNIVYF